MSILLGWSRPLAVRVAALVTGCWPWAWWWRQPAWPRRPSPSTPVPRGRRPPPRPGGKRAGDGTWTFDLPALGNLWPDPISPLAQNGVVLSVDPAASPGVTQVGWLDVDSGKVAVDLLASAPADAAPAAPAETLSGP